MERKLFYTQKNRGKRVCKREKDKLPGNSGFVGSICFTVHCVFVLIVTKEKNLNEQTIVQKSFGFIVFYSNCIVFGKYFREFLPVLIIKE